MGLTPAHLTPPPKSLIGGELFPIKNGYDFIGVKKK